MRVVKNGPSVDARQMLLHIGFDNKRFYRKQVRSHRSETLKMGLSPQIRVLKKAVVY